MLRIVLLPGLFLTSALMFKRMLESILKEGIKNRGQRQIYQAEYNAADGIYCWQCAKSTVLSGTGDVLAGDAHPVLSDA